LLSTTERKSEVGLQQTYHVVIELVKDQALLDLGEVLMPILKAMSQFGTIVAPKEEGKTGLTTMDNDEEPLNNDEEMPEIQQTPISIRKEEWDESATDPIYQRILKNSPTLGDPPIAATSISNNITRTSNNTCCYKNNYNKWTSGF
jgi:hypothetical protein